ncbi:MAG: Ig-like domain-containing protein [Methanobacterium sp.]|uniref:Ig-like domain-containing protein n=1 Tax=Methanobacterium sp. TaxID=2164 RepID=UPI003C788AA9
MLNIGTSAAATVTNGTAIHTSPKVITANPANNSIITKSQTITIKYNTTIKTNTPWIELKNGNTAITTKYYINGSTLCITPTTTLATGIRYSLTIHTNSISDLTGNGNSLYSISFTLSPITLAQMKDGQTRTQAFFNNNQRLPNYVTYGSTKIPIAQFQKIIATQGLKINTKITNPNASLASIMKGAAKYGYSHAASTAAAMERIGAGDCWAMSDYLYTKMTAAHMQARIIQYPTAYSSRHESVQYKQNGVWVNAPYRSYGLNSMFNNTQSNGTVIRCS